MRRLVIRLCAAIMGIAFCLLSMPAAYHAYINAAWSVVCVDVFGLIAGLYLVRIASTGMVFGRPVDARR